MNRRLLRCVLGCLTLPALVACGSPLGLTVLFDQVHGLKKGDCVVWEQNRIGRVADVRYTEQGRFEVTAEVEEAYRAAVTDRCRFVVSPEGSGEALEMVRLEEGGTPLRSGAVVQGRTSSQLLGESLGGEVGSLLRDVSDVSGDWAGRIGQQLDRLTQELGRAGDQARERLRREVLPEVERQLEQLRQWIQERARGDEAEPSERRPETLQRT